MKKFKYFYLALAVFFCACDKEVIDQIVDENLMRQKTLVWVDDDPTNEFLYGYAPISALIFSKFGGKPFINGCEDTEYNGIKLCKDAENKDNGNITVFFGPEALCEDEEDTNCIYNLTVRYKGALNTVWAFNVKACVDYCAKNGPISLYVGEKMGTVVLVRYDGKTANVRY